MWKRKELKKQAKQTIKKNYWTAVVVCFLIAILTGEFGASINGNSAKEENLSPDYAIMQNQLIMNEQIKQEEVQKVQEKQQKVEEFKNSLTDMQLRVANGVNTNINSMTRSQKYIFKIWDAIKLFMANQTVLAVGLVIASIIAILYLILIAEPLIVAERKYFLTARDGENTRMGIMKEVFRRGSWSNVTLIMLLKNIYNFLWFFTIIGGFIKAYEYRMIPYILAENPKMDRKEVFKKSKEMMKGNKWRTFILDVSFIGWIILSVLTGGLLGIFYVNPYRVATSVELYEKLKLNEN